jgi:hypothetical protein
MATSSFKGEIYHDQLPGGGTLLHSRRHPLTLVTYLVTIYSHDTKIHTQGFKKAI